MEDVRDVYHRDFNDDTVRVCVDEVSKQLTTEVRMAVPMEPGRPARVDCEYERNGTANLFMVCAPLRGWRHVKVTERRPTADFATRLAALANVHFPNRKIVLVMDNRNTHKLSGRYHVYPPKEARRLSRRFEVHHTPKHGSGLNIAESEISVLSRSVPASGGSGGVDPRGGGVGGGHQCGPASGEVAVYGGRGAHQAAFALSINSIMSNH